MWGGLLCEVVCYVGVVFYVGWSVMWGGLLCEVVCYVRWPVM